MSCSKRDGLDQTVPKGHIGLDSGLGLSPKKGPKIKKNTWAEPRPTRARPMIKVDPIPPLVLTAQLGLGSGRDRARSPGPGPARPGPALYLIAIAVFYKEKTPLPRKLLAQARATKVAQRDTHLVDIPPRQPAICSASAGHHGPSWNSPNPNLGVL